jgi:hypothetical protein
VTVLAWWLLVGVCVLIARRVVQWLDRGESPRLEPDNVIRFAPRTSRTGRPVPPAVPRGPRRRGDAA